MDHKTVFWGICPTAGAMGGGVLLAHFIHEYWALWTSYALFAGACLWAVGFGLSHKYQVVRVASDPRRQGKPDKTEPVEEIGRYKLEIQELRDEKRRLLEAQSQPCSGCRRRDDMVADREYSALFVLLMDSRVIQTDYSKLKLPFDSAPLSDYEFPASTESWDYTTRKKAILRDEVKMLTMRAEYFCCVFQISDAEFLQSTKNSGVTLEELQRSLTKFEMKVHSTLEGIKPRLTQEFARVPVYREHVS